METGSPAMSVAIGVLAVLLGLTGFGVYQAFGPPSKGLDDPFDGHEDLSLIHISEPTRP